MKILSTQHNRGFALPVVIITSVVMMIVLLSSISVSSSVTASLQSEHYQKLAAEAAKAGATYADQCLSKYGASADWSVLYPGADCKNKTILSNPCNSAIPGSGDPDCQLLNEGRIKTTFEVTSVTNGSNGAGTFGVIGTAHITRESDPQSIVDTVRVYKKAEVRSRAAVTTWRQISAGLSHTCAVAITYETYCWGGNVDGALGNNSTTDSPRPVGVRDMRASSSVAANSIATGNDYSCAIASDNKAYCWGGVCAQEIDWDYYYETYEIRYITTCHPGLGNDISNVSLTPVPVSSSGVLSGKTILSLSSQMDQTCALASDNKGYCWGYSANSASDYSALPVAAGQTGLLQNMTLKAIKPGYNHACAIASDNYAYCWGNNTGGNSSGAMGKLGNNVTTAMYTADPVAVYRGSSATLGGKTIRAMAVGAYHTCVIASDNKAYCWGDNDYYQLGSGLSGSRAVPIAVKADSSGDALYGKTIKAIAAGRFNTCVIASDDKAYCWGTGSSGQNGNGTNTSYNYPVAVSGGYSFASISVGYNYACGITLSSKAYCWGLNTGGKLGNDSITNSNVPVPVSPSTDGGIIIRQF